MGVSEAPKTYLMNLDSVEWTCLSFKENDVRGSYNFATCLMDNDIYIFGGSQVPFNKTSTLHRISFSEGKKTHFKRQKTTAAGVNKVSQNMHRYMQEMQQNYLSTDQTIQGSLEPDEVA